MRRLTLFVAASAVLLVCSAAHAQDQRGFSAQNFQPAAGAGNFLTQEGGFVSQELGYSASGLFHYQYKPVVIRTCDEELDGECTQWSGERGALLRHQLTLELMGSIAIFRIFEAALAVPFIVYQTGNTIHDDAGATVAEGASGHVGLGDIRLHLKLDLLNGVFGQHSERFGLALVPVLTFPVGHFIAGDSFMGDSSVTVHPKVAFEVRLGRARLALNLGYMWRESKTFFLADMGHRLTYGVAAEVQIAQGLDFIVELFGQNGFSSDITSSPLEIDAAVRYRILEGLHLTAGAGMGLVAAVSTPWLRLFAGIAWTGSVKPKPSDGDRDGDGIPDERDECPRKAEDEDGFEDDDGCPDRDNDGDGIADKKDKCPLEPEDKDKFEDKDGCPDPDNDGDGIADEDDECPKKAEDDDGFEDDDGCPDRDNDMDGIPDDKDECPEEKEVFNDVDDEDGCPDEGKALLEMGGSQIQILEKINFATDSDEIVGHKSFKVLRAVKKILKANPDMKIRIEGHTDDVGSATYNMALSKKRAESVKKWLVDEGIDGSRIETVGIGPKKPITDNDTKEGRAKNRRVEFHIVDK
ncbi:MAG: OmpA family protein [Deltaproteobacteria bacterium]|nr:OmpA family protein [Deltaproteobacteria bacterium]